MKLGVRWDGQILKSLLTEGDIIQMQNNYSPRVGFTWDVTHDGKSKFYGFYGQYVERVPTDMAIRSLAHEYSGYEYFWDPQNTVWRAPASSTARRNTSRASTPTR